MTEELADLGPDPTLLLVDDDEPFVKRLVLHSALGGYDPITKRWPAW